MTPVEPTDRWLVSIPVRPGSEGAGAVTAALRAALDGTGPAVVPVPTGPAGAAVRAMARTDEPLETPPDGDHIALVVPTSGSTGQPKGALLSTAALRASAAATLDRLGGPGQWLLALPLTHIAGLQVLIRSLLADIEPVALPSSDGFDPADFAAATARLTAYRCYTALVPTQLRRLLDGPPRGLDALVTFDAVLVGGAALDTQLRTRAIDAGVRVVTTYGMSETSGGCVYDGVPLPGVRVNVSENGPVRLGGPHVFSGYRLRPDLTRAALEVVSGVRWHVTADLGRLDADGRLHILGRVDDVIVTGGENVAPGQVEAALASQPAVAEVVVVGMPDPEWGQRVVAVVVASDPSSPPTLAELRAYAADSLPPYALPKTVELVATIPLLTSGKPDRQTVRAWVGRAGGASTPTDETTALGPSPG